MPLDNYKKIEEGVIIRQEEIATGIFSMWVKTDAATTAVPGQFCNIYTEDNAHLLGRPISICQIDRDDKALRFVYQAKGFGTLYFSTLSTGAKLRFMGPLGNGFSGVISEKKLLLIGGGMGIAPLLGTGLYGIKKTTCLLGYRDEPFLYSEFKDVFSEVLVTTESGRQGIKGNVLDALKTMDLDYDMVFICGPKPMMAAVWAFLKEKDIETFVSLEEKMACGLGACLGCVVDVKGGKLCVCKDGPVFNAKEVNI